MVFTIRWAQFAQSAYSFGSQIAFTGHRVTFHNPLMSPSYAITSWSSKTNFQQHRIQPTLPLLKRKTRYCVQLEADVYPLNTLYVKVTFFNRFDTEISFVMLKDERWSFSYPEDAFSYTIELINAGCEQITFDSLVLLEEKKEELDVLLDDFAVYAPADHSYIHVLFLEENIQQASQLPLELLQRLGNVMLIGDKGARLSGYLGREFEETLKDRLHFYYENGLTKIRWIGYGSMGNVASLYYSSKWHGQVYITPYLPTLSRYQRSSVELTDVDLRSIWERRQYAADVQYYSQKRFPGNQLMAGLVDDIQALASLPLLHEEG